jgi:ankyrin repeat protein
VVDVVDAFDVSPLFVAALKGNLAALMALLAAGACATGVDSLGRTVLHCAVETKRADVLEALFERRPQDVRPLVDQRGGRNNATPLHLAINRGDLASVKYLMEVRARVT